MKPRWELSGKSAVLRLDTAWYGAEAVKAGAAAVAGRARVAVARGRAGAAVTVTPASCAGDFLDAALGYALRAEVVAEARPFTGPALARVYESGFTAVPKDPLEEMDPAVAERRARETAALAAEAA